MNIISILEEVLSAVLSQSLSFSVAGFNVSISIVAGSPQKLGLATAIAVVEAILAGKPGTFQVGDVSVTISEPKSAVAVTEEISNLAALLAPHVNGSSGVSASVSTSQEENPAHMVTPVEVRPGSV